MKKFLALLIAVMLMAGACAYAETATSEEPLAEGEMYFHGYINPAVGYYVGVPAEWALIGLNSTPQNLTEAYDIMGYTEVTALHESLNAADNNILFSIAATGEQMVLTYGPSDGITVDRLAEEIDAFKAMLQSSFTGIEFKEDSGLVSINDLTQIMYIGAKYKSHDVSQYFMPAGSNMYVFTFTDVEKDIAEAVISTFRVDSELIG
ncbi:MAG: hypothetical protein IKJ65_05235 [Clostridia bacterium]|nr:hypothetical protein [Clostridia bacterium]